MSDPTRPCDCDLAETDLMWHTVCPVHGAAGKPTAAVDDPPRCDCGHWVVNHANGNCLIADCPCGKVQQTAGGQPAPTPKDTSAFAAQVGGNHYRDMAIQPAEFIHRNGIGFLEGCAIKYLCRWKSKGGLSDLRKARHFIDLLIEMEGKP